MNLREGHIGAQEGISILSIAISVNSIFARHSGLLYQDGNSSYVTALISTGISLGVFLFCLYAMKQCKQKHFLPMLQAAFGKAGGDITAGILIMVLLLAAGAPLSRFLLIFSRFIYVNTESWNMALYIIPVVIVLSWMGLETIGRTSRLLVWILLASLLVALILAIPGYETYRLQPILGDGVQGVVNKSLGGIYRVLPGLIAWLLLTRGAQGTNHTKKVGIVGGSIAGVISAITHLGLGLSYPYMELASMHSPMYRLTMMSPVGLFQRLDKILLFFWLIGAILGSAFYVFAAAQLFCRVFHMQDVRPAVVSMGAIVTALALLGNLNIPWFEEMGGFLNQYGWMFALVPLLLCGIVGCIKAKINKENRQENTYETA